MNKDNFYELYHKVEEIEKLIDKKVQSSDCTLEEKKVFISIEGTLNELIEAEIQYRFNGAYIVSQDYRPCTMCGKETNIVEVCSEGRFCSKQCEEKFYKEMCAF